MKSAASAAAPSYSALRKALKGSWQAEQRAPAGRGALCAPLDQDAKGQVSGLAVGVDQRLPFRPCLGEPFPEHYLAHFQHVGLELG